jgi:hypothetical protein
MAPRYFDNNCHNISRKLSEFKQKVSDWDKKTDSNMEGLNFMRKKWPDNN